MSCRAVNGKVGRAWPTLFITESSAAKVCINLAEWLIVRLAISSAMNIRDNQLCVFGWLAHSRNSRLRLFTENTQFSSLRLARDPGAIRTEHLGFGSSRLRIKIGVA